MLVINCCSGAEMSAWSGWTSLCWISPSIFKIASREYGVNTAGAPFQEAYKPLIIDFQRSSEWKNQVNQSLIPLQLNDCNAVHRTNRLFRYTTNWYASERFVNYATPTIPWWSIAKISFIIRRHTLHTPYIVHNTYCTQKTVSIAQHNIAKTDEASTQTHDIRWADATVSCKKVTCNRRMLLLVSPTLSFVMLSHGSMLICTKS